jgi:hypothetical protein
MATPVKVSALEKIALNAGHLYRYHFVKHGPRRKEMLVKIWNREMAPPKMDEWPQVRTLFFFCCAFGGDLTSLN